jgi:hypothetical protein
LPPLGIKPGTGGIYLDRARDALEASTTIEAVAIFARGGRI